MIRAPSWLRLIPGTRTRQLGTRFSHSGFLLLETKWLLLLLLLLLLMPRWNSQRKQFWMGLTDGRREGSWVVESTLKAVEYVCWQFWEFHLNRPGTPTGHMESQTTRATCGFMGKEWIDTQPHQVYGTETNLKITCNHIQVGRPELRVPQQEQPLGRLGVQEERWMGTFDQPSLWEAQVWSEKQHPEHYCSELSWQQYQRFPPIKNHFDCKTNQNPYPDDDSSHVYPSTKEPRPPTGEEWEWPSTKRTTRRPWDDDHDWDWSSEETDEIYW